MPLILLPGATFKMLQDVASLMHLQNPNSPTTTHSLRVTTPNWKLEEGKTTALYAYKIDPLRGLIPKEIPNGALYLSYALAAQGNMKDAFRYFQMATIGRSIDRAGQDIVVELKSLLDHYPSVGSSLPYKAALQLRAKLFTLQLQKKEKISSQDLQELQQLESIATPLRMQFTHEEIAALNTLKKQATNDTVCAALRERICELKSHLPAPPKAENRSPSPQSASKGPTTSYANQIEQELQADLQSFKNRDSSKGVKRIHHGTMQQAEQKKAAILQRFTTGSQKEIDDIRRLQQLATASGTTAEELLFQKALRDFGEGKCWDPSLHQEIQEYLQLAICASQGGQATFHYNIRENSIAPTILLLEYQLGFTCRPSQIQVVEDVLSRDNCFKQEICGGGKTTVLRNILSHVKADGATLAGVSTLEPLRGEHGPQLARTTSSAFGQRVFDFHFDRTSPTTEESLLTLYKNLLETTINRGRIDLSKKDLHSFRSALILKQESLQEAQLLYKASEKPIYKEQIERLNREIDIMEDCREFLMTRVALISDELDKDTDCAEEFNYALGATAGIESTKQTVLITFFQELFSSKTPHCQALGKAIRQNEQKDLSTETIHAALEEIATRVAQHYMEELSRLNLGLNKEEITNYLLDKEPAASKTYKILLETKTQAKNELCFLHQYISSIAPTAFCKKGGVSFGRSVDGVRVIPFLGSDKPKEGSEHGKETERLFYTCLDYLDASRNGVDLQQIENYYLDTLKKAQAEVNELAKQNPLGLFSIDETKTAKAFRERFPDIQKPLSQVTPEDCVSLHKKINSDPHAVLEHLRRFILPELRQSPEKIVGNAQDIPSMVHSFSGFSGTDTAIHAMPDKIDTQNARQAGAHGEILTALYTSEKELKEAHIPSFLSIEANEPPYLLLASQISWGDALSDVGKLFPGIPSQTIAQNLLRELCEQGKLPEPASEYTIWFIDAQDQWKMVSIDGTVSPADPSQDPKKRIAVFDDVHTRGAERPSTAGVTEFVTLDIDTTWSRFEQGVMRERGLTRLTDTSKNKAPPGTGTYQARVRYILSPALKKQLDSSNTPLQLSNILHHLFSEEAKALQSVNLQAEVQKIEHILKSEVDAARLYMTRISKEKNETHHRRVREAIYSQTRHLFVKSTTVTPEQAGAPAVPVPTDAYLNSLVEKELKNLRALLSMSFLEDPTDEEELLLNAFKTRLKDAEAKLVAKFSEEVQKSISIDCSSFKSRIHPNYLPEKISASQIGLGQDQSTEVEQEQETQQEQEVAQEVASEKQKAPSNALFEYIPITLPTPDELSSLTTHPLLHKRVDLGLLPQQYGFYTENFCPTIRTHGKQTPGSHNIPLLNKTLLIIDAQNRVFEIHGSRIDVDRVFIPYVNQYQNGTELQSGRPLIWVHDYSTGAPPASITEKLSPDQARAVMRSICATKLANLDITLDTASKDRDPNDPTTIFENSFEAMVSYLKTLTPINGEQEQKKGPKLLEALENEIREKIALERPSIVYENSPLAHAFKQAKESMTQPGL